MENNRWWMIERRLVILFICTDDRENYKSIRSYSFIIVCCWINLLRPFSEAASSSFLSFSSFLHFISVKQRFYSIYLSHLWSSCGRNWSSPNWIFHFGKMNSSQALCDTANYLAHDTQLIVMLCIRVVVAITGLVFFAVLFKIQGTYMAFHDNARLLIMNHHIWVVIQSVVNLLGYSSTLIRFAQPFTNPCQYVVSTMFSVVFAKGPAVFTVYGQVWALASMAIERCFATYTYRDYETRSNGIGKILVMAQVHTYTTLYVHTHLQ